MKFNVSIFFDFIIVFLIMITSVYSNETISDENLTENSFADYLYQNREYHRALDEYQRELFELEYKQKSNNGQQFSENKKSYLQLRIAETLYFTHQPLQLRKHLNKRSATTHSQETLQRLDFLKGVSFTQSGLYKQSSDYYAIARTRFSPEEKRHPRWKKYQTLFHFQSKIDKMRYWLLKKETLPEDFEAPAKPNVSELPAFAFFSTDAELFYDEKTIIEQWPAKHTKSIWLASLLSSAIPGAGQIYTDNTGDGISSFLVVAFFTGLTALAWQNSEKPTAWVFGISGLAFYAGNVYGAAKSAADYNSGLFKDYDKKLLQVSIRYNSADF